MKTTRYYVLGTPERPVGLIRATYDPTGRPVREITRYNSAIDDFVPNAAAARWVLLGDTMLTEIPYGDADDARARIKFETRGVEPLAPEVSAPEVSAPDVSAPDVSAPEPDKARTKFYKEMPEAERLAATDEILLWIRSGRAKAEAKATVDPEWWAQYGEQASRAANVLFGLPEDYDEPDD